MATLDELQQSVTDARAALDAKVAEIKATYPDPNSIPKSVTDDLIFNYKRPWDNAQSTYIQEKYTADKLAAAQSGAPVLYTGLDPATGAYTYSQNGFTYSSGNAPSDAQQAAYKQTAPATSSPAPESPTNPSATEEDTAKKYSAESNFDSDPNANDDIEEMTLDEQIAFGTGNMSYAKGPAPVPLTDLSKGGRAVISSEPKVPSPAIPTFKGSANPEDPRVMILVPKSYLIGQAAGPNQELSKNGGIVFPYTPSISQEYRATYNSVPVTHSNYTQYFYKNSSVGEITLTGKFSVQNEVEAGIFLSTVHLLRALTKMKYGDDANAGSPPPVCRLKAYGPYGFDNTPVAISSFKLDYPDNVDFFETGNTANKNKITMFGITRVPVMNTISLTLTPIYSRNEMQKFNVKDWLSNNSRTKGYL